MFLFFPFLSVLFTRFLCVPLDVSKFFFSFAWLLFTFLRLSFTVTQYIMKKSNTIFEIKYIFKRQLKDQNNLWHLNSPRTTPPIKKGNLAGSKFRVQLCNPYSGKSMGLLVWANPHQHESSCTIGPWVCCGWSII